MATEAYKERAPSISFSPPVRLTNDFYKNKSSENLGEAGLIILHSYSDVFGIKNTPMGEKLAYIAAHPGKIKDGQAMFGVEPAKKKGEAVYSVKITTDSETSIFSLRVGDFTELSYMKDDKLVERHFQKGKNVVHEVFA